MNNELLAGIVGAVVGGLLAMGGGVVQILLQQWLRNRGTVDCEVVNWAINGSMYQAIVNVFNHKAENVGLMQLWVVFKKGDEEMTRSAPFVGVSGERPSGFFAMILPSQTPLTLHLQGNLTSVQEGLSNECDGAQVELHIAGTQPIERHLGPIPSGD